MHLGNARTALLAWLDARAAGGAFVMRVEDLDAPRVVPGAEARILEELAWLGLDWDEGPDRGGPFAPYRQSERAARYDEAARALLAKGAAFECACSRAEVVRAASAPHPGEEGPRYPGTCRDLLPGEAAARAKSAGRAPVLRFRAGAAEPFRDRLHGECAGEVDDFVIRRADGVASYQLAVTVDDAAMGVTHVVRADDLLDSTPRQLALYRALGLRAPSFAHVPLVLAPEGERLAKRNRPAALGELRGSGVEPEVVAGALAASAGLIARGTRIAARDLVASFDLARIAREPAVLDAGALS